MKSQQFMNRHGLYVNDELKLVSVIIPVYNVAPYLREALDSAVNQTYRHLEIIIVEDGSTDGSEIICDEYCSDSRVQVIHQEHRGVGNARNTGLDHAAGEYIAFLDPDDIYHADFIRQMLEAIKNADVVVCRQEIHKLTLDTKGQFIPMAKAGSYDRAEVLRAHVNKLISASVCDKLFRKELWKNIRFPDGHNYEDLDTVYRILNLCSHVNVLNQVLYFYRKRPGSITNTNTKNNNDD